MLGHSARHVGVVMLDRDLGRLGAILRVARGSVERVKIVGDDLGVYAEEPLGALDGLLERANGVEALEVADVRAEVGGVADTDTEGVLEMSAAGQDRPFERLPHRYPPGHVAAGPPKDDGPSGQNARDRVVRGRFDLPVVQEEEVGDASELLERVAVAVSDGLVGEIARGHHQRSTHLGEEQVMQGGVRQDQAHERVAGRDAGGDGASRRGAAPGRSAARSRRGGPGRPREQRDLVRGREIADHHREGLLVALLPPAQLRDGVPRP